jgi:hypothetical protein
VDAAVQRLQPEPVVTGPRGGSRAPERRRREGEGRDEAEPHFPLDPRPHPEHGEHGEHAQARSPNADGLGGQLDVTA